ncbi:MAG: dTDP-4-amino-4,6-dideoxygalactose transaminase [Elusimicrobiota bacterium]|nr:dTDP-4-amino-4,6-dideoxygalactose transaminase [Elusimicrobiota bacterium]
MIPFNKPPVPAASFRYLKQVVKSRKLSGDHEFTRKCHSWLRKESGASAAFLTPSGTHALEMAALLAGIKEGDEVIMPSFTFSSTANAFILRGARIVFVDVRPDTMNIDERLIPAAITRKTKVIVPVHYAGVSCEMDAILELAKAKGLCVIEDAAQAVKSSYHGRPLGGIGDFGAYSFHETKNYTSGEGGAILIKDPSNILRAEIVREKGTNRSRYFRGEIDKYSWEDIGSSYLPSEISAAFLFSQLEIADKILNDRLRTWDYYYRKLKPLADEGKIELPCVTKGCSHNGHLFFLKVKDLSVRTRILEFLKSRGVLALFHYVPLHSSKAGRKYGRFVGKDRYTTSDSERLFRLPLYYGMAKTDAARVCGLITEFCKGL